MRTIFRKPAVVGAVLGWACCCCLTGAALADPYSELGVSKDAFSGANGWKGAMCKFADAGTEADVECAMMEVAKNEAIVDGINKENERFRVVSLSCPDNEESGMIEYHSKSDEGLRGLVRVTYKNGHAVYAIGEAFNPKATVASAGFKGRPAELVDEYEARVSKKYLALMAALKDKVCFGSAKAKERYFDRIKENRLRLKLP